MYQNRMALSKKQIIQVAIGILIIALMMGCYLGIVYVGSK